MAILLQLVCFCFWWQFWTVYVTSSLFTVRSLATQEVNQLCNHVCGRQFPNPPSFFLTAALLPLHTVCSEVRGRVHVCHPMITSIFTLRRFVRASTWTRAPAGCHYGTDFLLHLRGQRDYTKLLADTLTFFPLKGSFTRTCPPEKPIPKKNKIK